MGIALKWDVTSRCNFRCPHCCNASYTRGAKGLTPELPLDEIKGIVDKLAETKCVTDVTLMGGEPTMRKDLEDIIRYCNAGGIRTQIVSNGSALTPKRIDSLLEAGNWGFTISIDGPTPEAFGYTRPFRVFPHLMKHLRYLTDRIREIRGEDGHTHNTCINSILHKKNLKDVSAMIDLAVDYGVDTLDFIPLTMPGKVENEQLDAWQSEYTAALVPTAEECLEAAVVIGRRIDPRYNDLGRTQIDLKFLNPAVRDLFAVKHDIWLPLVGHECAAVTTIGSLNHDGNMVICEALDAHHEAIERGEIEARPLSLREQSFWDIWNSKSYQQMFSWVFNDGVYQYMEPCRRCPHLYKLCRPCPERAIALAVTKSSDVWHMSLCCEVTRQAPDLYALKEQADAILGTPTEEQIAFVVAHSN